MHDALLVRRREPAGDLRASSRAVGDGERARARAARAGSPLDELHRDVDAPVGLADLVDDRDVGVRDGRRGARLAQEAAAVRSSSFASSRGSTLSATVRRSFSSSAR